MNFLNFQFHNFDFYHNIFYHCDKDTKLDYDRLKNIFLYNENLNYTFEIDHKKLFEEYNNRIYYLVIFGGKSIRKLKFGKVELEIIFELILIIF